MATGKPYLGGFAEGYAHGWKSPIHGEQVTASQAPGGWAVDMLEPVQTVLGLASGGLGKAGQAPVHLSKLPRAMLNSLPARYNPVNRVRANTVQKMLNKSKGTIPESLLMSSTAQGTAQTPKHTANMLGNLRDYYFPRPIDETGAEPIVMLGKDPESLRGIGSAFYKAHGLSGEGSPASGLYLPLGQNRKAAGDVVAFALDDFLTPRGAQTAGHEIDHLVFGRTTSGKGYWQEAPPAWADDVEAFQYHLRQENPQLAAEAEKNVQKFVMDKTNKTGENIKKALIKRDLDPDIHPIYYGAKPSHLNEERITNARWGGIPNIKIGPGNPFLDAIHKTGNPYRETVMDIRGNLIAQKAAKKQAKEMAAAAARGTAQDYRE